MSFVSSPPVLVSNGYNSSLGLQNDTKNFTDSRIKVITHKGKVAPVRFVVHEIIKILAKHKRPLHTLELEKALRNIGFDGVNISTNKELYELLQNNKVIDFNTTTKRLFYINRFESIVSQETLLSFIVNNVGYKGLKVNVELLSNHNSMVAWINDLLKHRKIRAIRSNITHLKGKKKCRYVATNNQCSLYTSNKCQECYNNLEGVVLFPLGKEQYEQDRYKLDHDIKGLWDSVAIPSNEQLLREYNLTNTVINLQPIQQEKKKRKETKGYKVKMRKIYNTHLFTPQELRDGVNLQLQ